MSSRIRLNFAKLGQAEFSAKLKSIAGALEGGGPFAPLAAQAAALGASLARMDEEEAQRVAAWTRMRQHESQRDAERAAATARAAQLAAGVRNLAAGDAALVVRSGFELIPPRGPCVALAAPGELRAVSGPKEGTISLRWRPVRNARSYVVEMSDSATGPWVQAALPTRVSCVVAGLPGGQVRYFRVRAVGHAGFSPWSDITERRAG